MIELPASKWSELVEWFDIDIADSLDYGVEKITEATKGRPFLADFENVNYHICVLKQEIHDEINLYELLEGNHISTYGVERRIFIHFHNSDDELLFKLTYL